MSMLFTMTRTCRYIKAHLSAHPFGWTLKEVGITGATPYTLAPAKPQNGMR